MPEQPVKVTISIAATNDCLVILFNSSKGFIEQAAMASNARQLLLITTIAKGVPEN